MARKSEVQCKEMIRGETSQMLYPYPEYEKPFPVVILDTTVGDITLEMHMDKSPRTCRSFLEHCRNGYFEPCLFNRIQKDLWVQCGDPTSTGRGGESIYGPTFDDEHSFALKHDRAGVVSMCNKRSPNTNGSQFFITLGPCSWLNGKNVIFAQVVKGMDVLKKMNKLPVNKRDRRAMGVSIQKDHNFDCQSMWIRRSPTEVAGELSSVCLRNLSKLLTKVAGSCGIKELSREVGVLFCFSF